MSESDNGHVWIEAFGLTCCKICMLVKRADGTSKPCKGPGKLRELEIPFQ